MASLKSAYGGSTVLVTGGTGSIGVQLVKSILKSSPKEVRVLTNDENGLFELRGQLIGESKVTYKLGDVRDSRNLDSAVKGCDYVFHAAALKHVNFCEGNPYEAISTNIIGTQNMIEASVRQEVKRFVFISTDKAVNPTSTLGATKLLGERLVITASRQTAKPVFSIARFGNVIGSRGSVLVIFEKQVREGSTITVTDPRMTRFIMAPSEASELILKASVEARSGEIFVLKMKAVRIGDLAEAAKIVFAKANGKDPKRIRTVVVGAQPGEKMHEELMNEAESNNAVERGKFFVLSPEARRGEGHPEGPRHGISSSNVRLLTIPEIVRELSLLYGS